MMKCFYNLNCEDFYVEDFCENIEVFGTRKQFFVKIKVGTKIYDLSITPTVLGTVLILGNDVVTVENEAFLKREFFEEFSDIAAAQKLIRKYSYEIPGWSINFGKR